MRNQTTVRPNFSLSDFVFGLVLGGLAGTAVALLTAPQSGVETRAQLREKTEQFRDKASSKVEGALEQAESVVEQALAKGQQIRKETEATIKKLGHRGQAVLDERIDDAEALLESVRPGRE